jgi:hypothetical protein
MSLSESNHPMAGTGETGPSGEVRVIGRRGFFVAAARGAAAAGLTVLGVFLAFSGRGRLAEEACQRMGVCRGCGRADDCELPQALSMRQEAAKGGEPSGV